MPIRIMISLQESPQSSQERESLAKMEEIPSFSLMSISGQDDLRE